MRVLQIAQTRIFRQRVRDVMKEPWPRVKPDTPCRAIINLLREHGQAGVIVINADQRLVGILTRGDLLRQLQSGNSLDLPADHIMRAPVSTVREQDLLFHAIALMRRAGAEQLPVLDSAGRVKGNLPLNAALAAPMDRLLNLVDQLSRGSTAEQLRQVKANQAEMARIMLQDGLPTTEVQALLTEVNNDLYSRIVTFELERLADEGWGNPPIAFDVVVMGSGGRGESFLSPDQDNGFVLQEYPDNESGPIDAYFIELASRMCRTLDGIGIPYCRGHVMATNPLWRKHLGQWKQQVGYWLARPSTATLRLSDIFFDFSAIHGKGELTAELRRHVVGNARHRHGFLRAMQQVQDDHGVALGPLGRLLVEHTPGYRGSRLNLKYHGLLPLVEGIRLLALREGIAPCPTLLRMVQLADRSVLDRSEHDYLRAAFQLLTELLLQQQIHELDAGRPAGNYISTDNLGKMAKGQLVDALKAISAFRARLHTEFTGEI